MSFQRSYSYLVPYKYMRKGCKWKIIVKQVNEIEQKRKGQRHDI